MSPKPSPVVALERLRIGAREMAHLMSDLTSLSYGVPVDNARISSKLCEVEQCFRSMNNGYRSEEPDRGDDVT